MSHLIFVMTLVVFVLGTESCKFRESLFSRIQDLSDLVFTDSLLFQSSAVSVEDCAHTCASTPSCLSFTYPAPMQTRGTCRGHATRELSRNDATPSAGTVAFLGKKDKCPRSWKLLGESCYKYISIAATWQKAQVECETMGAGLVEIDSEEENFFVFTMVTAAGAEHAWLGLNDVGTEGLFLLPSGQPPTFTKWQSGEPNDFGGREDCAMFRPGNQKSADGWIDAPCDTHNPFVCEQHVLF